MLPIPALARKNWTAVEEEVAIDVWAWAGAEAMVELSYEIVASTLRQYVPQAKV